MELSDFVRMFLIASFVGSFVPRGTIVPDRRETACITMNAVIWQIGMRGVLSAVQTFHVERFLRQGHDLAFTPVSGGQSK